MPAAPTPATPAPAAPHEDILGHSTPLFQLSHVSKVYQLGESEVHALTDATLDIYAGEFLVLLGASGSGKSTLLNILGGLDRPTAGTVRYLDHDLMASSRAELTRFRRDHVGFVFQFYNLLPSLTALENVALVAGLSANPFDPMEALALVDMQERAAHFPAQLSGGEQQRVAIARAIAKQPDVLLCDEPTGALDYATGKVVLSVLQRINHDLHTTMVVITHNAAIGGLAHRVARVSSGRVADVQVHASTLTPDDIAW